VIAPSHADLLERPIVCDLATVRPDGSVQLNPMWFLFDGEDLRFSHTSSRAKYRNLLSNPRMTALIVDPDDTQRYVELRGELAEAVADPTGEFHQVLAVRYGEQDPPPPPNAADRVVLVMRIDKVTTRNPPPPHEVT
jgi:PPOX class probable F420-dependent enzyme